MGENFISCKGCHGLFRDDDIFGKGHYLFCKECLEKTKFFDENYPKIESIVIKILEVVGKDNELTPDFYGEIFFNIMMLGEIENSDKKRYFRYSLQEAERRLDRFLEDKKNGK